VSRFRAARRDVGLAVLEGLHPHKHALRFGAELLETWTDDAAALERLARELAPDVTDALLAHARSVDAAHFRELAPGPVDRVVSIARRPVATAPAPDRPIVLLEEPTHHGNVGAVVRVAAAAGAAAVLTTGRHDPWHPSALRGSAGLHWALPVRRIEADDLPQDRPLVAIDPEGEPAGDRLPAGAVLAFGSERRGLSRRLLDRAERRVAIPMRPGVSSLNLATAVAVILYASGLQPGAME